MIVSRKTSLRTVLAVAGALLVGSVGFEANAEKGDAENTKSEQGLRIHKKPRKLLGTKEGRAKANLRNKKRRKPTRRKRTPKKAKPANEKPEK